MQLYKICSNRKLDGPPRDTVYRPGVKLILTKEKILILVPFLKFLAHI
jgi:hypothetical protein